jgi:Domain of unknown function (DUF5655)
VRSSSEAPSLPPLWRCPRCGKSYVTRNLWHSCVIVPLDQHFEGRPAARDLFGALVSAMEREGPVTISVSKTRIELMTRARFAGVQVRRDWLRLGFWLKREIASPRFSRVEHYGKDHVYQVELRDRDQLDPELMAWLREARTVGDQVARQASATPRPGGRS